MFSNLSFLDSSSGFTNIELVSKTKSEMATKLNPRLESSTFLALTDTARPSLGSL